jgi:hypothetical protein
MTAKDEEDLTDYVFRLMLEVTEYWGLDAKFTVEDNEDG